MITLLPYLWMSQLYCCMYICELFCDFKQFSLTLRPCPLSPIRLFVFFYLLIYFSPLSFSLSLSLCVSLSPSVCVCVSLSLFSLSLSLSLSLSYLISAFLFLSFYLSLHKQNTCNSKSIKSRTIFQHLPKWNTLTTWHIHNQMTQNNRSYLTQKTQKTKTNAHYLKWNDLYITELLWCTDMLTQIITDRSSGVYINKEQVWYVYTKLTPMLSNYIVIPCTSTLLFLNNS